MEIDKFKFLRIKEMQRNFCTCYIAFSNCYTYNKRTPKRPIIKNKACHNRTPKLNMSPELGTCPCDRTTFTARPGFSLLNFHKNPAGIYLLNKVALYC